MRVTEQGQSRRTTIFFPGGCSWPWGHLCFRRRIWSPSRPRPWTWISGGQSQGCSTDLINLSWGQALLPSPCEYRGLSKPDGSERQGQDTSADSSGCRGFSCTSGVWRRQPFRAQPRSAPKCAPIKMITGFLTTQILMACHTLAYFSW